MKENQLNLRKLKAPQMVSVAVKNGYDSFLLWYQTELSKRFISCKNTQNLPQIIFEGFFEGKVPLSHLAKTSSIPVETRFFILLCYDDFNY